MPPAVYQDGNESRVTCMKNYAWWLCHKYDVNYMIMQWQYDKNNVCHDDERWLDHKHYVSYMIMQRNLTMNAQVIKWKQLHGDISRNGHGKAIIKSSK